MQLHEQEHAQGQQQQQQQPPSEEDEDREAVREDLVDSLLAAAQASADLALLCPDPQQVLFPGAHQHLQRCADVASAKSLPEVFITWGQVLVKQAEHQAKITGQVDTAIFEAAVAKISEALVSEHVNPVQGLCERGDALFSFASALTDLANRGQVAADQLPAMQQLALSRLDQARKDYETAVQLEPETPSIFSKLGDTLFLRWRAQPSDLAPLTAAVQAYHRSMNVPFKRHEDPDTIYNMAAALAILGNSQECCQLLRRWKTKTSTPQDILSDPDFASVREADWFKKEFA